MGGGLGDLQPGQTPLGDVSDLIPSHIRTQEDLNRAEFENINTVLVRYLLKRPSNRKAPFTFKWLLKLHREMFGDVWAWAGICRKTHMNIGIDAYRIPQEIHRLISDLSQWRDAKEDALSIAVRLHHRLVWIHPFAGGNGRWARMVSNISLKQANGDIIEWPEQEITQGGFRELYISALKSADSGDLEPLIALHGKYQNRKQIAGGSKQERSDGEWQARVGS